MSGQQNQDTKNEPVPFVHPLLLRQNGQEGKNIRQNIEAKAESKKVVVLYTHKLTDDEKSYFDKVLCNHLSDNHLELQLDELMAKTDVLCVDLEKYGNWYGKQVSSAKKYVVVYLCRSGIPYKRYYEDMKERLCVSHVKKHVDPEQSPAEIMSDLLMPYTGKLNKALADKAHETALDCFDAIKKALNL